MKPTSALDTEVLLSEALGGSAEKYVDVYKEKNKPNVLVKPKRRLAHTVWQQIHYKVKDWGGKWSPKQQLWEVPI